MTFKSNFEKAAMQTIQQYACIVSGLGWKCETKRIIHYMKISNHIKNKKKANTNYVFLGKQICSHL